MFEVKPLSGETLKEYHLDPEFFEKGTMVQDILNATSGKVSDFTHLEAAYLFDRMATEKMDPIPNVFTGAVCNR